MSGTRPTDVHTVLVVDVDAAVAAELADQFDPEHYEVHISDTLEQAEAMLSAVLYAVVIVNTFFVANEAEQWQLIRSVRASAPRTRVLFLRHPRAYSVGFRDGFAGDAVLPRSTDTATIVQVVQHLAETLDRSASQPS
jgi:hypothetical protein